MDTKFGMVKFGLDNLIKKNMAFLIIFIFCVNTLVNLISSGLRNNTGSRSTKNKEELDGENNTGFWDLSLFLRNVQCLYFDPKIID